MDKVSFVGKDGKVFFECHSAEVRIAIDAIQDHRTLGFAIPPEERKYAQGLSDIHSKTFIDLGTLNYVAEEMLTKMYQECEATNRQVTHVIMHPSEYANLRRLAPNILDIETKSSVLKGCKMVAKLWGGRIYVDNSLLPNRILIASCEEGFETVVYSALHTDTDGHEAFYSILKEVSSLVGKAITAAMRMKK